MNKEQTISICPLTSLLPEITMHRINSDSENDFHYEISADEDGRIRKIRGEFGKDIKIAARILLRTLLRLNISPENALKITQQFYLAAKRHSVISADKFPVQALGNSSSSF